VDEKAAIAPNQLQKEPGNPTRLLALVETLPYTAPNPVREKGVEKSSFVQTLLLGYNRGSRAATAPAWTPDCIWLVARARTLWSPLSSDADSLKEAV